MKADDAMQVLADLLQEKDLPTWMTELAVRRNQLTQWLRSAEQDCDCQEEAWAVATTGEPFAFHEPNCDLAKILRILGGPKEIARQTNGAHEEALIIYDGASPGQKRETEYDRRERIRLEREIEQYDERNGD